MTASEMMKRECEEVTQRTGRYIPPYRMTILTETAHKIVKILTAPGVFLTYYEQALVLRMVLNLIREVTGEEH